MKKSNYKYKVNRPKKNLYCVDKLEHDDYIVRMQYGKVIRSGKFVK